uniref:Uncharacterized protein n=1 Tax=Arundo donax TaxID=35708 RepID=A0A0A9BST1_ARUDO
MVPTGSFFRRRRKRRRRTTTTTTSTTTKTRLLSYAPEVQGQVISGHIMSTHEYTRNRGSICRVEWHIVSLLLVLAQSLK